MDNAEVLRKLLIIHDTGDNLSYRMFQPIRFTASHAQSERCLRIQIHKENVFPLLCQSCGKIYSGSSLSDLMRSFA